MTLKHALEVFEKSGGMVGTKNKANITAHEIIIGPKDKSILHKYILEYFQSESHEYTAKKLNIREFELYVQTLPNSDYTSLQAYITLQEFIEDK